MAKNIQSVERAAAVLRVVGAAGRPVELAEIAQALDLPRTTTHGIVRTLREVGLLTQPNHSTAYALGRRLATLGRARLDPNDIRSLTTNYADALASHSRQAVFIGVPHVRGVAIIHHVFRPDDREQTMVIGAVVPFHATALGKATLAFAPSAAGGGLSLERFTGRTVRTRGRLDVELSRVRAQGFALDVGEHDPDLAGIAAPLRTVGGLGVGAVGIVGTVGTMVGTDSQPRPDLVGHVRDAATAMSRAIVAGR
ncbi:MAG: IclR family transcriptional regulator [Humibacillus sp.]|nr:IclR family transcriptional regulator [Humibacillus sp.]MDN5778539.1 IclR family transcriptional regulator [Humibacillus sp.]